mmetsp:Transcript_33540/g.105965  ORF Transcript_33540/g.105965 Transcript_33540/m.105965 type:complete len:373 (-) Transcript_33540:680-1798(-)
MANNPGGVRLGLRTPLPAPQAPVSMYDNLALMRRAKQDMLHTNELRMALPHSRAASPHAQSVDKGRGIPRPKRQKHSTEERAKRNRDRNREHARNTRLRKKAYTNKLQELVQKLQNEDTQAEKERNLMDTRAVEQARIRARVVATFFKYLLAKKVTFMQWTSIIDEDFELMLPTARADLDTECEVLRGVNAVRNRATSLHALLDILSLGEPYEGSGWRHQKAGSKADSVVVTMPRETVFQGGDKMMCTWCLKRGSNAGGRGIKRSGDDPDATESQPSPGIEGSLCATFSPQSKIVRLELIFDVARALEGTGTDYAAAALERLNGKSEDGSVGPLRRLLQNLIAGRAVTTRIPSTRGDAGASVTVGRFCEDNG